MFLQKHYQRQPRLNRGQNKSDTPPPLWARVPVCLSLLCGDLQLRSVSTILRLPLNLSEVREIEAHASQEHTSIEASFVNYLREVIFKQEKTKEIIKRLQQQNIVTLSPQSKQEITVDIQLKGKIVWEVEEEQLFFGSNE